MQRLRIIWLAALIAGCEEAPQEPPPNCGNNQLDFIGEGMLELCDGTNLDGRTCESFGPPPGTLACDSQCVFDFSGCTGEPAQVTIVLTNRGPAGGKATVGIINNTNHIVETFHDITGTPTIRRDYNIGGATPAQFLGNAQVTITPLAGAATYQVANGCASGTTSGTTLSLSTFTFCANAQSQIDIAAQALDANGEVIGTALVRDVPIAGNTPVSLPPLNAPGETIEVELLDGPYIEPGSGGGGLLIAGFYLIERISLRSEETVTDPAAGQTTTASTVIHPETERASISVVVGEDQQCSQTQTPPFATFSFSGNAVPGALSQYALDITDPARPSVTWNSAAGAVGNTLWVYSAQGDGKFLSWANHGRGDRAQQQLPALPDNATWGPFVVTNLIANTSGSRVVAITRSDCSGLECLSIVGVPEDATACQSTVFAE
jgi:hypothetical protein